MQCLLSNLASDARVNLFGRSFRIVYVPLFGRSMSHDHFTYQDGRKVTYKLNLLTDKKIFKKWIMED